MYDVRVYVCISWYIGIYVVTKIYVTIQQTLRRQGSMTQNQCCNQRIHLSFFYAWVTRFRASPSPLSPKWPSLHPPSLWGQPLPPPPTSVPSPSMLLFGVSPRPVTPPFLPHVSIPPVTVTSLWNFTFSWYFSLPLGDAVSQPTLPEVFVFCFVFTILYVMPLTPQKPRKWAGVAMVRR